MPYFWEDAAACMTDLNTPISKLVHRAGLRVFNFHPIHVFLDTEELRRYEQARPNYQNLLELIKLRNQDGNGTRDRLKRLLGLKCDENHRLRPLKKVNQSLMGHLNLKLQHQ